MQYTLFLFISTSVFLAACRLLLLRTIPGVSSQLLLFPNSSSMGDRDLFLLQSGIIFLRSSSSLFFSLSRNSLLKNQYCFVIFLVLKLILILDYRFNYPLIYKYTSPVEVPLRQQVARHPQEVHDDVELVDGAAVADSGRNGCSFPG